MRRIWHDRSSHGFGRVQAHALGASGLLALALLGGGVQARLRLADPLAAEDSAAPVVVADRTRPATPKPARPLREALRPAPRFTPSDPLDAEMSPGRLIVATDLLRAEIERGILPGAALAIGRGAEPVVLSGLGRVSRTGPEVDPDRTVYDLASLTKVVATTTAAMLLVEDGRLELDAPVARYLPAFAGGSKSQVTVRHLLAHTSGLPAWADLWARSPEASLAEAIATPLRREPGAAAVYSDVGFVVLYAVLERAAGEPIPRLLKRRVFSPLGMLSTRYAPGEGCTRCAPTLVRSDGSELRGIVHDPIAQHLGGIAGNSGLFSTASDLARYAAMLTNGGELGGVRVLREETIRQFTRRQPGAGTRALGWDTPSDDESGSVDIRVSPSAYGHTGFTGTSLWIDPERRTWTVLLTNRTYFPDAPNRMQVLRRALHDQVARAASLGPRLAD